MLVSEKFYRRPISLEGSTNLSNISSTAFWDRVDRPIAEKQRFEILTSSPASLVQDGDVLAVDITLTIIGNKLLFFKDEFVN